MVIDFHTHAFPDKIADRTIEVLEANILKMQGKPKYAVIAGTLDALKKSMEKNNIDDMKVFLGLAEYTMITRRYDESTEYLNKAKTICNDD